MKSKIKFSLLYNHAKIKILRLNLPNVSTMLFIQPIGLQLFSSTDIFKSSMGGKSWIVNSPFVLTYSFGAVWDDIEIMLPSLSDPFSSNSSSLSELLLSLLVVSSSELQKEIFYIKRFFKFYAKSIIF